MQRVDKVREGIEVARGKNLVDWDISFTEDANGTVKPIVLVAFSYERAKTQLGETQGAHVGAHALNVMRAMKIVSDFTPMESNRFAGMNQLVEEMTCVQLQDNFLWNYFRLGDFGLQQLQTLSEDVVTQRNLAKDKIEALSYAIAAADGYQNLAGDNSLQARGQEAEAVLDNLGATETEMLEDLKLDVRRNYCMSVTTKAAVGLLEYQNAAPYATFERIKPKSETERSFDKGEGRRVRDAMATLKPYGSSRVEVQVEMGEEEGMAGSSEASVGATTEDVRRAQPARGAKTAMMKKAEEDKLVAEKKDIVNAICNLLYYPPVDEDYSNKAKAENSSTKRTNDLNALGFVISRHIATVFATFDGLEKRADKQDIMEEFIDRMLHDWGDVIKGRVGALREDILTSLDLWTRKRNGNIVALRAKAGPDILNLSLGPSPIRLGLLSASAITPRKPSWVFSSFKDSARTLSGRFFLQKGQSSSTKKDDSASRRSEGDESAAPKKKW